MCVTEVGLLSNWVNGGLPFQGHSSGDFGELGSFSLYQCRALTLCVGLPFTQPPDWYIFPFPSALRFFPTTAEVTAVFVYV